MILAAAVVFTVAYCADLDTTNVDELAGCMKKAELHAQSQIKQLVPQFLPQVMTQVMTAQRQWENSVKADCAIVEQAFKGGLELPIHLNTCRASLAEQRVKDLRDLLEEVGKR